MSIEPISFVKKDVELVIKSKDDNGSFKYRTCVVKSIEAIGNDEGGNYINCKISYNNRDNGNDSDGAGFSFYKIADINLYNINFENESSDKNWKFSSDSYQLLQYIVQNSNNIQYLKDIIDSESTEDDEEDNDNEEDKDDEDKDDEDKDDKEDEDEGEEDEETQVIYDYPKNYADLYLSFIEISEVAVRLSFATFLTLYSYKLVLDLKIFG
jgi:hypothetical protein